MGVGLETLFHLVYEFFHWVIAWCIPAMKMVEATDMGVKITGDKVKLLQPGRHLWHQQLSSVYTANVMRQTEPLADQLLTTKDGKRVRVGGVLVYRITDALKWLIENEDSAEAVKQVVAHALREVIITTDFEDMQQARAKKRDELTRSAQEMLGMFGVRVEYLRLTTFAESDARDLHHSGTLDFSGHATTADEDEE